MSPGEFDGTEEGFWQKSAVVVGKIIRFDAAAQRAEVEVFCVASTNHVIWRTMYVNYVNARGYSNIFTPEPGEFYVLCVFRTETKWCLDDATYTFMQSHRAVDKVEGLDDKKVARTLERIRLARKGITSKDAPSTQPAK